MMIFGRGLLPWAALVALLFFPLTATGAPEHKPEAGTPAAQPADSAVRVVSASERLQQAIEHYQQSEFEEAYRLLKEIIAAVGQERSRTAQEAYTYLGYVQVAFGEKEKAVQAFERALALRPELKLNAPSPSIAAAFAQAKSRYRERIRALDHDPPSLQHYPPKVGSYHQPLLLLVRAQDPSGVKRVVLNCRTSGNRGFNNVVMERDQKGAFVASIPASLAVRPAVEYYIEAWDELGNGPGLKGSHLAPIRVPIEGGPAPEATATASPSWYKRWWVWAIAASAVAVAGGAGAAIYFSREETGRLDIHPDEGLTP